MRDGAGRGGWYYETKSAPPLSPPLSLRVHHSPHPVFNIMFARSLAARLPARTPLVAAAANPGLCRTAHRRHLPAPLRAASPGWSDETRPAPPAELSSV